MFRNFTAYQKEICISVYVLHKNISPSTGHIWAINLILLFSMTLHRIFFHISQDSLSYLIDLQTLLKANEIHNQKLNIRQQFFLLWIHVILMKSVNTWYSL